MYCAQVHVCTICVDSIFVFQTVAIFVVQTVAIFVVQTVAIFVIVDCLIVLFISSSDFHTVYILCVHFIVLFITISA